MAAKKKPVESLDLEDLELDADEVGLAGAWTAVDSATERPARTAGTIVKDEGEGGKVLSSDAPEFADYLVVPKVDALQAAFDAVSPAAVLVVSSAEGKEIAARLALRIGSGIITDATDLEAGEQGPVATQAVFAASYTTKSRVSKGVPVITVKPNSAPVEQAAAAGAVEALTVSFGEGATGTKVTSRTPRESTGRP
ncbi:hypothetical protein JHN55_20070, partial [Streptomyces sp. MBT56]|nr:hypothetical protein [Streptomyces sp. MBT56]